MVNIPHLLILSFTLLLLFSGTRQSSVQIKELRPNENRYFSNFYDTFSDDYLRSMALGTNQYSLSCWVKFSSFPASSYKTILFHLTLLNNSLYPSDYTNIPSSYQHLSQMILVDVITTAGITYLRGFVSYFGTPNQQVFPSSAVSVSLNTWYFIYAGSDQVNKQYTIGYYTAGNKKFDSYTASGLLTDGNEQLDNRLVVYFGGSKGVPYGSNVLFNGYITQPLFYANYYTASNPEYLIFGEASKNYYFKLDVDSRTYIMDNFGSYSKISFGASDANLQTDDPLFTQNNGLQFSTTGGTFMTITNQFSFSDFTYVSFWVYLATNTNGVDLSIFSILNTNNDLVFEFYIYYDSSTVYFRTKCLTTVVGSVATSFNVWSHVLIVFSKSSIFSYVYFSFFLNGIDQYSQFNTNFVTVTPPNLILPKTFVFGKSSTDSSFSGYIQDLYTGRGARVLLQPSSLSNCQLSIGITQPYCLYCSKIAYIYNGTCVLTCPSGTFRDISTMTCRFCSASCNECDGPLDSDCLSCVSPYVYNFDSRCFDVCPFGTKVISNYTCSCDDSCQTCAYDSSSGQSICQTCVNPSHFIVEGYKCVQSAYCPYNYFGNTFASSTCSSTCSSGTFKNFANRLCSSYCTSGAVRYEANGVSACYQSCPSGYFSSNILGGVFQSDQTQLQCLSCASPCAQCTNSSCLSCTNGLLFHENNGSCLASCLPGFIQDANVCRVCRSDCSQCPNNYFLFNGSCLSNCPVATSLSSNNTCVINSAPLVTISNITGVSSKILKITRKQDLVLTVDYVSLANEIDSILWSLSGVSSVYSSEFFSSSYKSLKTLTIPKINIRGNVLYNVSVAIYAKGVKGEDFILIQTYPDIDQGVFNITPVSGVSGVQTFTMSLLLWNTSQNLSFNVYSYNQITVNLDQNVTIYSRYDPDMIFSNLSKNGNYTFVAQPVKETTLLTIELEAVNFDSNIKNNLTITLLPYNGNITQTQSDLWRVNFTAVTDLTDIYQQISNIYLVYGTPYSQIYKRDSAMLVYKAAKLLNMNDEYFCDDIIHCMGNGVCQSNSLNSKSYSCICFDGFAGDSCSYEIRPYQLLTNFTLTLMLNLQKIDNQSSINPLVFMKSLRSLLLLQDLFPKNGIILAVISIQDMLNTGSLNIETLTLIVENLGLIDYFLYERTMFRLDEQAKYTKLINSLLDQCLNQTESLLILGQVYFISSKYVDVYLLKKPRFSLVEGLNGSLIVPLSKVQVYIPAETFSVEDIVDLRVIQWKTGFEDIEKSDDDISFKGQVEFKFGGKKAKIQNLNNPVLIYLAKIATFDPLDEDLEVKKNPYICGTYYETSNSFSSDGCYFMNETSSFVLCNCSHFSTFSVQIDAQNISFPPSFSTLTAENSLTTNVSISSLLSVDFSSNLLASRYVPRLKKLTNEEINWNSPGLWAVLPLMLVYLVSCLLNIKNWKKNRFDQIISENKPIFILTYHPFISLTIKAHSPISHTQQMRVTKLFLTYFANLFGSAVIFTELVNVNSELSLKNRVVGSIIIGLILGSAFHYFVEFFYRAIFLQFCTSKPRNSFVYHLLCCSFMCVFGFLTIYEIGKDKYEDCIYWLYIIVIMFSFDVIVLYTVYIIYAFWTSNRGYFIPSLKYMGFYIDFDENSIQLPMDDRSEDRRHFKPDTVFPS